MFHALSMASTDIANAIARNDIKLFAFIFLLSRCPKNVSRSLRIFSAVLEEDAIDFGIVDYGIHLECHYLVRPGV